MLEDAGLPTSVAQVVQPGQAPEPVPRSFSSIVLESSDAMFFKENLWNLAAGKLHCQKLLFIDADLRFTPDDWPEAVSRSLDQYDVIQPFETAEWLNADGDVFMSLPPAAGEIRNGVCPVLAKHHPGFAWGMTAATFGRLGGWYDLFTSGAGDAAFAFAICQSADPELGTRAKKGMMMSSQPSYVEYRRRALSLGLSVGIAEGVRVRHSWHGDRGNRGYLTREMYFPAPLPGDAHIRRRSDGLLDWAVPAPLSRDYFAMRQEDGAITDSHATDHSIPARDGGGMGSPQSDAIARRGWL